MSNQQDHTQANQQVLQIFQEATPVAIDIQSALTVIPGMTETMLLHAGPPITWERMCGPMQGALLGALVYEGLAEDLETARALAESGEIHFEPCHEHDAVGPMAKVISPSMPVWVIEDRTHGTRAFCNLNEGPGQALRYGANGTEVLKRLVWMRDTLAPRLREVLRRSGGLPIFPLIHEALQMGDECHSRNRAALSLFLQALLPHFLTCALSTSEIADVLKFLIGRDYFFLNLTMAACKAAWLVAETIPGASIITAHSRNGVEFGIRLQGRWFTAPAPVVEGHYFPGFSPAHANLDIGDSAITEASGLGGFAVGAAPAITGFIGGTVAAHLAANLEMYRITAAQSAHFSLPFLGNRGTPTGVDVLKVLETGICPYITTGIAHRQAGIGQVGAGRVRAPLACFQQAAATLLVPGDPPIH